MESLYNVGNGLYKVFTIAKKGTFFPAKEGVHSRNIFSFFKWGTLAQKKGHFSLLKKVAYMLPFPPVPRPLLVWHTMSPKCPEDKIENVQKRAFRIIYSTTDYEDALNIAQCKRLKLPTDAKSYVLKPRASGWGRLHPLLHFFSSGGLNVFAAPLLTMVHDKPQS
jgi:hypothetical protein